MSDVVVVRAATTAAAVSAALSNWGCHAPSIVYAFEIFSMPKTGQGSVCAGAGGECMWHKARVAGYFMCG